MKKLIVASFLTLSLSLNCFGMFNKTNIKQTSNTTASHSTILLKSNTPDRPDPWG